MGYPKTDAEFDALVEEIVSNLEELSKKEKLAKSEASSKEESSKKEMSKADSMECSESKPEMSLSKDEETPAKEDTKGSEDSSAEDKALADAPPEAAPAEAPPADAPPAAAEAPPAPPAEAPVAPAPEAAPEHLSVEQLADMYCQLPPDQLEAHEHALQMAKMKAAPPAPPPAAAPAMAPEMAALKSEIDNLKAKLAKSEEVEKSAAEAKLAVEKVTGVLTTLVENQPVMRKAINGITVLPYVAPAPAQSLKKSLKEMSKSEITAKLGEVARDPKLSKSDRDLINSYVVTGANLDKLEKFFQ